MSARPPTPRQRAMRAFQIAASLGFVGMFAAMAATGAALSAANGDIAVTTTPLGLPLFFAERIGDTTTLVPQPGALVLLVVIPVIVALATYRFSQSARTTRGSATQVTT